MNSTARIRRETVIVGVGVAVIALLYRYAWLPIDADAALQSAAETWDIAVGGAGRWFSAWTLGDGQAFAVIAADPLGLDEGWLLGHPAYRYGRAGFGWLAWLFSLGREEWIPYTMGIVGLLALVATFALAAKLRPRLGVGAWLIVLNPAVLIGFAGDTAEALGVFALAWALATGQWWASAALGVIRPTFLVATFGRWKLLVAGGISAGILTLLWIARFGFDLSQYGGRLGPPLLGYLEAPSPQSLGLAVFALITTGVGVWKRNWAWLATGLFVLCFASGVVEQAVNGWRAAGMLFVLWAFGPDYAVPETSRSESPVASLAGS